MRCFDFYLGSGLDFDSLDESAFFIAMQNYRSSFVAELVSVLETIYQEAKLYYDDYLTFFSGTDPLKVNIILQKYSFFYDTTKESFDDKIFLQRQISIFKNNVRSYENNLKKATTTQEIQAYKDLTLNKIIDKTGIGSYEVLDSTSTADKLAFRILWHCYNKPTNKRFVLRTFSKFSSFSQVVQSTDSLEQALTKIEADLLQEDGIFLSEFCNDIVEYFETFKPTVDNNVLYYKLGDTPDTFTIKISQQGNTKFAKETEYYEELLEAYLQARELYSTIRIKQDEISGVANSASSEAQELLTSVLQDYITSDVMGINRYNEDPRLGNDTFVALTGKFLYYVLYSVDEKTGRNENDISYFFSKFVSNPLDANGYDDFRERLTIEQVSKSTKNSAIIHLNQAVKEDFEAYYIKKRKTAIENKIIVESIGTTEISSHILGEELKISISKESEASHLKNLLTHLDTVCLQKFEGLVRTRNDESIQTFISSMTSAFQFPSFSILNNGTYSDAIEGISENQIAQKIAFFYVHTIIGRTIKYTLLGAEGTIVYFYPVRAENGVNHTEDKTPVGKASIIHIGDEDLTVEKLYKIIKIKIENSFNELRESIEEDLKKIERLQSDEESSKNFTAYVNAIKKNLVKEDEFFYINSIFGNNKTIPSTVAVDVEFRTYDENDNFAEKWIPVSRRIGDLNERRFSNGLYADNYFDSLKTEDTGGKRTISLNLKSPDDINLEKIILNSLITPTKKFNTLEKEINRIDTINNLSKYRLANFRVRFGYNDVPQTETSVINAYDITDIAFSNRINNTKPVLKTPWLYFMINGITTNFFDGNNTFEITGIDSGNYTLENYRIYDTKNSGYKYDGVSAKESIGIVAGLLYTCSGKQICVLSDTKNKIVVGRDENGNLIEQNISLADKSLDIKTSDFEFDVFDIVFDTNNNIQSSVEKDVFFVEPQKEEGGTTQLPLAKDFVDALVNFLPTRLFAVPNIKNEGFPIAVRVPKREKTILESNVKELGITYEMFEADSVILGSNSFADKEMRKRSFIRFYYKGPISRDSSQKERFRYYKYRGGKSSIVKSISINNPIDFQKICGVIGGIEATAKASFYATRLSTNPTSAGSYSVLKEKIEVGKTPLFVAEDSLVKKPDTNTENIPKESSTVLTQISSIANGLTEMVYSGTMEILGDPFYVFDDDVEPWRHLLYLDITRYKDITLDEVVSKEYDYYSGLYTIKKIEHSIGSDGSFTTSLGIVKFSMVTNSED